MVAVGGDQVPGTVDDHRGVGLVAGEDHIERLPHRRHLGILQRAFGKDRRMAGGQQHLVALAERDFELIGEQQHHFGARPRPARLDKAEVAGRDAGL